jgi:hypothetical protein
MHTRSRLRHRTSVACTGVEKVNTGDWHVSFKVQFLWDVSDSGALCPPHGAVKRNRTDQRSEEHGLARRIRSKDRQCVSTLDAKAQISEDECPPKKNREVAHLEHTVHVTTPS